jgi:hypothetical protein
MGEMADHLDRWMREHAPADVVATLAWLERDGFDRSVLQGGPGDGSGDVLIELVDSSATIHLLRDHEQWSLTFVVPGYDIDFDLGLVHDVRTDTPYNAAAGDEPKEEAQTEQLPTGVSWVDEVPASVTWLRDTPTASTEIASEWLQRGQRIRKNQPVEHRSGLWIVFPVLLGLGLVTAGGLAGAGVNELLSEAEEPVSQVAIGMSIVLLGGLILLWSGAMLRKTERPLHSSLSEASVGGALLAWSLAGIVTAAIGAVGYIAALHGAAMLVSWIEVPGSESVAAMSVTEATETITFGALGPGLTVETWSGLLVPGAVAAVGSALLMGLVVAMLSLGERGITAPIDHVRRAQLSALLTSALFVAVVLAYRPDLGADAVGAGILIGFAVYGAAVAVVGASWVVDRYTRPLRRGRSKAQFSRISAGRR